VDALHRRWAERPRLIDGALATELERGGARLDDALWSARVLVEAPERIRAVHRAHAEAGAEVLTSASYQVSAPGFEAAGLGRARAASAFVDAVALAREVAVARSRPPMVAASLGPFGAHRADGSEYRGRYGVSVSTLRDFHARHLEWARAADPDLLAFETVPDLDEVEALVAVLAASGGAAWVSLSVADGATLADGRPLTAAAAALASLPELVAVGINCCPSDVAVEAVRTLVAAGVPRVLAYPNRGDVWDAEARSWTPAAAADGPESVARRLLEAGAGAIGGCCRTTSADLARMRAVLDAADPGRQRL
jgi:homocysteine S-methyltransferase